ncbi:MAG: metal-dependent hydrolase [Saprospiraceae bacterium]
MQITYLGHACFLIETLGKKLLVDPFIAPNPMAKDTLPALLQADQIQADYILITHGHQDHTADAAAIAKRTGAKVISNYEIVTWFGNQDIDGHPMNHGGQWTFDFGKIKYVNAVHSSVLPDGTYGGNPGGFVITNEEACIYIAGDTALTMDMKLIPMLGSKLDLAILPVGDNFTMGTEEALMASDFIETNRIIGCHYDTFGYIKIDHNATQKSFADQGKELILLPIGESLTI